MSYFLLQVLRAAGIHVELQQFGHQVGRGHHLGVLCGVVTYMTDGPDGGRLDVLLRLLSQTQGQLGDTLRRQLGQFDMERVMAVRAYTPRF